MHTMNRGNRFAPREPPVQVGDELEVTIEAVGTKGDGIAKKNGFVLFIPNVKEGQKVRIRVTKVLQKVGFAEVVAGAPKPQQTEEEPSEETEEPVEEAPEEPQQQNPSGEDSEDFGEEEQ